MTTPIENLMAELEALGWNDPPPPVPAPVPTDPEAPETPPEASPLPTGAPDPQAIPARATDRERAYRAAMGLSRTLSLLRDATTEAHEAAERLCEALAAARHGDGTVKGGS